MFPNVFDESNRNPNILNEITTKEELSGMFNWAIEGLKRLITSGKFSNSEATDMIRDKYEHMSNPVSAFINDMIEKDTESFVVKKELYKEFCDYCKVNKLPMMADNTFSKKMIQILGSTISETQKTIKTNRGVRCWGGIRVTQGTQGTQVSLHQ